MKDLSKMTKEELIQFAMKQQQQVEAIANGLQVKKTVKGGIWIKHSDWVERSETKNKDYIASINMGPNTAKALFSNEALLEQVKTQVLAALEA